MKSKTPTRAEVLLIEDSPGDRLVISAALRETDWVNHVHVVENLEEAIDFLNQEGRYVDVPRPDLILSDLYLPGDGKGILSFVRLRRKLSYIPVVMLSTSASTSDVSRCYGTGADVYLRKPLDPDRVPPMMVELGNFWSTSKRRIRERRSLRYLLKRMTSLFTLKLMRSP